jgi:hypothetical protein
MWAPFMQRDSQSTAKRASAYMPDGRVKHYWDLWRFATRTYADQLKLSIGEAWDMMVVYEPKLTWKAGAPNPTLWLQNRNLKKGTPYSQGVLEEQLKTWIE